MYLEEMNFIKEGLPPPAHWTTEDKRLALRVWNEYARVRREHQPDPKEED